MTKAELKEWVNQTKHGDNIPAHLLLSKIDQLDLTPEPEIIPFQWPYDEKQYEVVTRDGRKVMQLVKFEASDTYILHGVIDKCINGWREDGNINKGNFDHHLDLFLRKLQPEMVEAWVNYYPENLYYVYTSIKQADELAAEDRIGPAIRVTFPKPKP